MQCQINQSSQENVIVYMHKNEDVPLTHRLKNMFLKEDEKTKKVGLNGPKMVRQALGKCSPC